MFVFQLDGSGWQLWLEASGEGMAKRRGHSDWWMLPHRLRDTSIHERGYSWMEGWWIFYSDCRIPPIWKAFPMNLLPIIWFSLCDIDLCCVLCLFQHEKRRHKWEVFQQSNIFSPVVNLTFRIWWRRLEERQEWVKSKWVRRVWRPCSWEDNPYVASIPDDSPPEMSKINRTIVSN